MVSLLIMVLGYVSATLTSSRVVRTKYGDISGVIVTPDSRYLDAVEIFRGIPYASPPVGNLRFMPPVTGSVWSGVKLADKFGPACPQKLPDISNKTAALKTMPKGRLEYLKRLLPHLQHQSEDCLYLNIYVPVQVNESNRRYPVLVFIHGESYHWNSGNAYDGTVLASYGGLLVVTINYRLGVLGFLNSNFDPGSKSPSNYGLMDQIAALHWLQENISLFGGDPTNVTLMGHGTGAASINFLMTSSAVPEGTLFQRAILMSGSSLSSWARVREPLQHTRELGASVNCSVDAGQSQFLKCLRSLQLDTLLNAMNQSNEFLTSFGPSVDGVVIDEEGTDSVNMKGEFDLFETSDGTEAFVPGNSYQPVIDRLSRYDLLLGVVPAESFFVFNSDDVQFGIEAQRRIVILKNFIRSVYKYHLSEILATVINEYTDWDRPVQHPVTLRDGVLEALSDAQFVAPVVWTADMHSSARRNSYMYVFDYQTKYGDYQQRQGCIHGEELPYVFGAPLVGGLANFPKNYTKNEVLLSEATMLYWSNFVKTGTPNSPSAEQEMIHGAKQERNRFKTMEWTAYESVHKKYLGFDTKLKLKSRYRAHKLSFWLNLIPQLHKPRDEDEMVESRDTLQTDEKKYSLHGIKTDRNGRPFLHGGNDTLSVGMQPPMVVMAPSSYNRTSASDERDYVTEKSKASDIHTIYSTALLVAVGIGCMLLLSNIVLFATIYRRERRNDRSRRKNDSSKRRRDTSDSSSSTSNNSSNTPDVCFTSEKSPVENGGINIVSATKNIISQPQTQQKSAPLHSILKKTVSESSSPLILQPQQHLCQLDSGGIELTTLNSRCDARRCCTLPRPMAAPRMTVSPCISTSDVHHCYQSSGTLHRREANAKEFEDLRV